MQIKNLRSHALITYTQASVNRAFGAFIFESMGKGQVRLLAMIPLFFVGNMRTFRTISVMCAKIFASRKRK